MDWMEFDEEQFKKDTDTEELSNLEIIEEAIASLQRRYYSKQDGFRRIEKISLLAIHLLIVEKENLIKWLNQMLDNDNDIFSVIRVKDVLNKIKELQENYEIN